jgi:hypothetical protein
MSNLGPYDIVSHRDGDMPSGDSDNMPAWGSSVDGHEDMLLNSRTLVCLESFELLLCYGCGRIMCGLINVSGTVPINCFQNILYAVYSCICMSTVLS